MSKPTKPTCRIRPILMADPMAKAIRDQRKTQTRRVVKGVDWTEATLMGVLAPDDYNKLFKPSPPATCTMSVWRIDDTDDADTTNIPCPYGAEGDMLWVREAWARDPKDVSRILYRADRTEAEWRQYTGEDHPIKWSPSILMPKTASRSRLRITGITVDLLQEITDIDAIAEGVTAYEDSWDNYMWHGHPGVTRAMERSWPYQYSTYPNPRSSFASLIARISGADTWHRNPCVWVITFELVEGSDHDI